jgi:hypothetical protein
LGSGPYYPPHMGDVVGVVAVWVVRVGGPESVPKEEALSIRIIRTREARSFVPTYSLDTNTSSASRFVIAQSLKKCSWILYSAEDLLMG